MLSQTLIHFLRMSSGAAVEGGRAKVATFQASFDLFYILGSMTKEQKQKKKKEEK